MTDWHKYNPNYPTKYPKIEEILKNATNIFDLDIKKWRVTSGYITNCTNSNVFQVEIETRTRNYGDVIIKGDDHGKIECYFVGEKKYWENLMQQRHFDGIFEWK